MGVNVTLRDGTIGDAPAKVDSLNRLFIKEEDTPIVYTDVVDSSQTIIGRALSHDTEEDDPTWQLKQITSDGLLTQEVFADEGKFNQKWTDRLTAFPAGLFNNEFSMIFDGGNDYLLIGLETEMQIARDEAVSVAGWFKNSTTGEQAIVSMQGATNSKGWRVTTQSNTLRWHLSGGSNGERMEVRSPNLSLNDGNWHHFVVTKTTSFAASGINMIIDGVDQAGSLTLSQDGLTGSSDTISLVAAQICGRNTTTATFNGGLDEIARWSDVLTVSEAQRLYNNGAPTNLKADATNETLVGWWRNGDSGVSLFPTIPNASGTGSNLDAIATNMDVSSINVDTP